MRGIYFMRIWTLALALLKTYRRSKEREAKLGVMLHCLRGHLGELLQNGFTSEAKGGESKISVFIRF